MKNCKKWQYDCRGPVHGSASVKYKAEDRHTHRYPGYNSHASVKGNLATTLFVRISTSSSLTATSNCDKHLNAVRKVFKNKAKANPTKFTTGRPYLLRAMFR